MRNNYLQLTYNAFQVLLPYSPQRIYVNQPSLHWSNRSKLSHVEADLRCALTNTIEPRIKQLVASNRNKNHFKLLNFVKSFHSKHNLFANSYAMMCNSMILLFFFHD